MKKAIAALAIVLFLVFGSGAVANAHSFGAQGPPHEHHSCTLQAVGGTNCYRWILANGAIIQGSYNLMVQQWGYVGVVCSYSQYDPWPYGPGNYGEGWTVNNTVAGIWGSNGYHTYCQNPKYSTPVGLAGWSVNY